MQKTQILKHINHTQTTPKTLEDLCNIINTLSETKATPTLSTNINVHRVKTIKKIRSYHKYVFTNDAICAFATDDSIERVPISPPIEQELYKTKEIENDSGEENLEESW